MAAASAPVPSAAAVAAAAAPTPSAAASLGSVVMATPEAMEDATPSPSATAAPPTVGAVITPAQAAAEGAARAWAAAAAAATAAAPPTAAGRRAILDVAQAVPLPKKKAPGRGIAWTDDERLCLCKGWWLNTTQYSVLGTNQGLSWIYPGGIYPCIISVSTSDTDRGRIS